jgi:ribA/ribD-fused uncharacterized protein
MDKIATFKGEYEFLSNFSPHGFSDGKRYWPTVEHYYQAMKTADLDEQERIRLLPTPGAAKRAGRKVTIIPEWDKVFSDSPRPFKVRIMKMALNSKFNQNPDLWRKLLETGDAVLEEGNWWGDTFWGVCRGVGENWLGLLLMELRDELRSVEQRGREIAEQLNQEG